LKIAINRIFTTSNLKTGKLGSIRADLYNSHRKAVRFLNPFKAYNYEQKIKLMRERKKEVVSCTAAGAKPDAMCGLTKK
jgi:hypothetical protein